MVCPKCGSDNITTNNKCYGIGKGLIGAILIGPLGLIAGNIGRHDIICTCLKCGHTWNLKKQIEENKHTNITKQVTQIDYSYDTKEERENNIKTMELGTCCSVCGEKIYANKTFCPFCTASYKSREELNDRYNCGQYNNAESNGKCIYSPHCVHYNCQYKNIVLEENEEDNSPLGWGIIFAIVLIILFMMFK